MKKLRRQAAWDLPLFSAAALCCFPAACLFPSFDPARQPEMLHPLRGLCCRAAVPAEAAARVSLAEDSLVSISWLRREGLLWIFCGVAELR